MGGFQELVVQLQPVMDQPTRVVGPENRLCLGKTPSGQNLAVGDLLGDHAPQPAQLLTFQPVSSICASTLRLAASRKAYQVASALRDTRWIARQMPLRLIVNPKPCWRIAAASAWAIPGPCSSALPGRLLPVPPAPPPLRWRWRFAADVGPAHASGIGHSGRW